MKTDSKNGYDIPTASEWFVVFIDSHTPSGEKLGKATWDKGKGQHLSSSLALLQTHENKSAPHSSHPQGGKHQGRTQGAARSLHRLPRSRFITRGTGAGVYRWTARL